MCLHTISQKRERHSPLNKEYYNCTLSQTLILLYYNNKNFVLCTYNLVLWQSSYPTMLVCTFTLVSRVLGQSHVDLGLKLITQVTVLETGGQTWQYIFRHLYQWAICQNILYYSYLVLTAFSPLKFWTVWQVQLHYPINIKSNSI